MKMRGKISFRCALVAFAAIGIWVSASAAAPFSQLVVFGDSLSDIGNTADATFDLFPGPYYYQDRFSNGPVFVEALSTGLGLGPPVRSTAGGNVFAYGGAQTSGTGGLVGAFIRDIDEQVDQFLATRTADPNALFVVFAGSNDFVNGEANANVPVANLAEDVGRLAAAGARHFLVPNLPLLGHVPRFNDSPTTLATYNSRTMQFNTALATMLDNLETTNPALAIARLDVAALFNEALASPATFGLSNVTDAAAPGLEPGDSTYDRNQIAPNANEYLFWDDLHPTATVHAALAQRALALFEMPGDYNQNGAVDAADYVVWRDTRGQTGTGLPADGNGDRQIDAADYNVWRANFGATVVAGTASKLESVPEPATVFVPLTVLLTAQLFRISRRFRGPACTTAARSASGNISREQDGDTSVGFTLRVKRSTTNHHAERDDHTIA
jgi:phospholipase/lecithinase/hemolysin